MKVIGIIYQNEYYIGLEERLDTHHDKSSAWFMLRKPYLLNKDGQLQKLEMLSLIVPEKVAVFIPSVKKLREYLGAINELGEEDQRKKVVSIYCPKSKSMSVKTPSASSSTLPRKDNS